MIWFFLAGMIAGAVGITMLADWWVRKNVKRITKEEMLEELQREETKKDD